jgi:hypothetical protein
MDAVEPVGMVALPIDLAVAYPCFLVSTSLRRRLHTPSSSKSPSPRALEARHGERREEAGQGRAGGGGAVCAQRRRVDALRDALERRDDRVRSLTARLWACHAWFLHLEYMSPSPSSSSLPSSPRRRGQGGTPRAPPPPPPLLLQRRRRGWFRRVPLRWMP